MKVQRDSALGKHVINPTTPITVTAAHGTLRTVKLINPDGKSVTGAFSADKTSWHTTEALGYSKTYRLSASATGPSGETVDSLKHKYTTLTPSNMTMPYLNNIYGNSLVKNETYGVGMIPVVHFDESITDEKAAEAALQGHHLAACRRCLVLVVQHRRALASQALLPARHQGHHRGQRLRRRGRDRASTARPTRRTSFTIGRKHVAIANAKTHQVKVYFNDKLKRTMPTSMGQGGVVQGKNGPIYLWTMPGTYTVINFENPAIMSSDSYGLPANSPLGYAPEKVYWSTKISTDGIYLHELDATVWAQGHENLSHGCLNLNYTNAKWYFNHSKIGDVVKVVHSGGPKLQLWQGGDWSVPWSKWQKGDATS